MPRKDTNKHLHSWLNQSSAGPSCCSFTTVCLSPGHFFGLTSRKYKCQLSCPGATVARALNIRLSFVSVKALSACIVLQIFQRFVDARSWNQASLRVCCDFFLQLLTSETMLEWETGFISRKCNYVWLNAMNSMYVICRRKDCKPERSSHRDYSHFKTLRFDMQS